MDIVTELNTKQKLNTRLIVSIWGVIQLALARNSLAWTSISAILLAYFLKNPTFVYGFVYSFSRDASAGWRFLKMNLFMAKIERRKWTVAHIFQDCVQRHPKKPCILMDDRVFTFQEIENLSNRIGGYFKSQGLQHGDCVALLMETRPEYACLWLGLSKIGVVSALINSNLRRDTLLHSIKVVNCKAIIVATEMNQALEEVLQMDDELLKLKIYQFKDQNDSGRFIKDAIDLNSDLQAQPTVDLSNEMKNCKPRDKLLYIYTSGTTGLPKAAVITNLRYTFMTTAANFMLAFKNDEVIYNSLPLYHTAGGIVGVGNALIHGCTVVLRKKFSASNFWKDCIKYKCTMAQYIGELCRYLLSSPPKPEDKQHQLRMMYGNGLRPHIWLQFVKRFNIPIIGEVYGSTEGNSNLANINNKAGSIGFIPILARNFMPVQVIKCDEETGEPIRGKNGYCQRCKPGETGLLIGVVDHRRAVTAFNGYVDEKASQKKLLKDVFRKGDLFFNSGDMIVGDIFGYFYFKDRTGDTYRWRGENVSTLEVESIITSVIGLQDCVVYGVEIPFTEGKAGMAAIVDPNGVVDLANLSAGIRHRLPLYAQPLFIRILDEIPRTATFKMKKRTLMSEGYNVNEIKDPIYYLHKDGVYRRLTKEQYENIQSGKAGL